MWPGIKVLFKQCLLLGIQVRDPFSGGRGQSGSVSIKQLCVVNTNEDNVFIVLAWGLADVCCLRYVQSVYNIMYA